LERGEKMEHGSRNQVLAFVGSYANRADEGLYVCRFNPDNGELTVTERIKGLSNPTFLDVDPVRRIVYVLAEEAGHAGGRSSVCVSYSIDNVTVSLKELNREQTMDAPLCHILLDRSRKLLFTASYHSGLVGVAPVLEDGRIGQPSQVIAHKGSSVLPVQSQARAHSVFTDPDNRYAVVCDLGMDQVVSYRIDVQEQKLYPNGSAALPPGSGPRHFAFHPVLPYGYSINELSSTISVFHYGKLDGTLSLIQTISTLPEDFTGESATADIHISPDGRFLYGSNRGHDSIAVFSVDAGSGRLTSIGYTPTQGGHPRNFALSLDGRFLLAANRDGNNIVVFARDSETGLLQATGHSVSLPKPVCIKFAALTMEE
jgi:6-phosphogluconolactonase